jgi:hypothetical protein
MSSGVFNFTKYAASYATGAIHPIRVQPETVAATIGSVTNAAPTGAVTNPIRAKVTGSKKSLGLVARRINLRLVGDPPAEYAVGSRTRIPALNTAFYAAAIDGATCSYLGTTWRVTGKVAEVPES